jgi:mono/diheme cytochrome c family protein
VVLTLSVAGCDFYYYRLPSPDDLWHVIPWFDHMIHARYIRPYETEKVPRYTPEGTVPVGAEPDWSGEWVSGKTTTANALKNPFASGSKASSPGPSTPVIPRDVDAAGDTLYQTFCSVCHGPTGNADGTVSRQIGGAPSLLTARARAYSDGYIYSMIRYGRGVMPRYGDKVYAPIERWAIVNHVRKLQRGSAAPPGPAAPIPPGPSATGSTGTVTR